MLRNPYSSMFSHVARSARPRSLAAAQRSAAARLLQAESPEQTATKGGVDTAVAMAACSNSTQHVGGIFASASTLPLFVTWTVCLFLFCLCCVCMYCPVFYKRRRDPQTGQSGFAIADHRQYWLWLRVCPSFDLALCTFCWQGICFWTFGPCIVVWGIGLRDGRSCESQEAILVPPPPPADATRAASHEAWIIAVIVVAAVATLLLLLLFVYCCCRRVRRRKGAQASPLTKYDAASVYARSVELTAADGRH